MQKIFTIKGKIKDVREFLSSLKQDMKVKDLIAKMPLVQSTAKN